MITLFLVFAKIGLFGYGGGLAMLPLIFQSVQALGFMSEDTFSDLVAIAQVTPGPIAINAATFVGMNFNGLPGATLATLGVILPSFIIVLIVMRFMDRYYDSVGVQGALRGMRAVVVGLVAAAIVFIAQTTFPGGFAMGKDTLILLGIAFASLLLVWKVKMNPIWITLIMAGVGVFALR